MRFVETSPTELAHVLRLAGVNSVVRPQSTLMWKRQITLSANERNGILGVRSLDVTGNRLFIQERFTTVPTVVGLHDVFDSLQMYHLDMINLQPSNKTCASKYSFEYSYIIDSKCISNHREQTFCRQEQLSETVYSKMFYY